MVLTKDEFKRAAKSTSPFIQSCFSARSATPSFVTQCCCDREIQTALRRKASPAYDFNCKVIHNPHEFPEFSPFSGCGWKENPEGPENDEMDLKWKDIVQADMIRLGNVNNSMPPATSLTSTSVQNRGNHIANEDDTKFCNLVSFILSCFG